MAASKKLGLTTMEGHATHIKWLWVVALLSIAMFVTVCYYVYDGQQQNLNTRKFNSVDVTEGTVNVKNGGYYVQATNKSTGVTANTPAGVITTHNTVLAAGVSGSFTVTNNKVRADDVVVVSIGASGATTNSYIVVANEVTNGAFDISLTNNSNAPLTENVNINYVILGGSRS
jgi:fructoselysine-6-P-deglycase FrlB-like protein